jgi:rRNA-processing protein Efg1
VQDAQKSRRRLKNARKRLNDATEADKSKLKTRLHLADVDYHYATCYPLGTPYIPLFPRRDQGKGDSESDEEEDVVRGDEEMRRRVETAMKEGKPALERLKNELEIEEIVDNVAIPKGTARGDREEQAAEESDDGEFFE